MAVPYTIDDRLAHLEAAQRGLDHPCVALRASGAAEQVYADSRSMSKVLGGPPALLGLLQHDVFAWMREDGYGPPNPHPLPFENVTGDVIVSRSTVKDSTGIPRPAPYTIEEHTRWLQQLHHQMTLQQQAAERPPPYTAPPPAGGAYAYSAGAPPRPQAAPPAAVAAAYARPVEAKAEAPAEAPPRPAAAGLDLLTACVMQTAPAGGDATPPSDNDKKRGASGWQADRRPPPALRAGGDAPPQMTAAPGPPRADAPAAPPAALCAPCLPSAESTPVMNAYHPQSNMYNQAPAAAYAAPAAAMQQPGQPQVLVAVPQHPASMPPSMPRVGSVGELSNGTLPGSPPKMVSAAAATLGRAAVAAPYQCSHPQHAAIMSAANAAAAAAAAAGAPGVAPGVNGEFTMALAPPEMRALPLPSLSTCHGSLLLRGGEAEHLVAKPGQRVCPSCQLLCRSEQNGCYGYVQVSRERMRMLLANVGVWSKARDYFTRWEVSPNVTVLARRFPVASRPECSLVLFKVEEAALQMDRHFAGTGRLQQLAQDVPFMMCSRAKTFCPSCNFASRMDRGCLVHSKLRGSAENKDDGRRAAATGAAAAGAAAVAAAAAAAAGSAYGAVPADERSTVSTASADSPTENIMALEQSCEGSA